MVKEEQKIEIYKIDTKERMTKSKKILIILIILALILVTLIIENIVKTIKGYKEYKSYENQIIKLQQEEARKQEELEKKRQEKLPKLTETGIKNIENIYHSDTKRAFLTFDDGPSTITPNILDILKQENIKATFFVLGSNVKLRPELVKRMYDEGHFIANHGYSHVYSSIYSSPQAVLDEYNSCNEEIKKAIGENEYNSHLFRFPGGLSGGPYDELKKQANEILVQNNIVHVDWNALNGDAETNNLSVDFELLRLNETIQNKNSIVILMHDSPLKSVTAEALLQIIETLRNQGYEFKNFYEIIK